MERYQTHQVHRVRVMRIHREGLLATKLGIEMCAGPQMANAGFVEHRGFAKALGARFRGFSLAFARDHWRISPQPAETVSDSFVIRKLGTRRRRHETGPFRQLRAAIGLAILKRMDGDWDVVQS